ncbi:MAG: hypothetical protein M3O36_13460 [Myxococcota bacterium]|nr:hypothetical protein [Myxococcota bacterium]
MKFLHGMWIASAVVVPSLALAAFGAGGCSSSSSNAKTPGSCASSDGGTGALPGNGFTTQAFTPPCDPGAGGILFSASGEVLSLGGFKFPPNGPVDTYMVDGWNFVLTEYLTVFDHITLWDNPNAVPTDQSQHGGVVAHVDGPWVADLHKGGPLSGKGGAGEQATPIAAIGAMDNGRAFDPATTYGFGFSTVAAPANGAKNVNLDSSQADDYAYMVQNGYSVLYVGTATWAGGAGNGLGPCTSTSAGSAGPGLDAGVAEGGSEAGLAASAGYDFTKLPPSFQFRMGFNTPTHYVNCQNGTDLSGMGVNGEAHPRGVQVKGNQSIVAQVTIHMDHPFWESFAENSPLHWDQIAAQYLGAPGVPVVHTEDMKGVSFLAFTDKGGTPLPWRNCSGGNYTPPGNGQMSFDPLTVPVDPSATDPSKALRDYYDYMRYTQATQGHLNSQGLCFIARQYPAPGGGSGR